MEITLDKTQAPAKPNQAARIVRALNAGKQIVITVSRQPTIDQMVAAIGLASLINKQASPAGPPTKAEAQTRDKTKIETLNTKPDSRAARNAVVAFAGPVHPKIGFLKTDEIITKTVDNYRELVIAIDKDKADKLRYSLDKKMARVHISPFLDNKAGLSIKDLEIGPGDFNIDVLVAIGVDQASDFEPMIGDNIELLKNRQTITMVTGSTPCQIFGAEKPGAEKPTANKKPAYQPINWCHSQACCLSEMIFDLAKEMKLELDESIATIILTGFLSATDRVKSRAADAEQIGMISRLVKVAGIDNKQLIIDYIENEKLQLPQVAAEPAKQKAATAKKSTKEQLLTEQEATKRIRETEVDSSTVRTGRELGLRVASERRTAKLEEKKEDSLIGNLDDIQVDESGQIIHGPAVSPVKPITKPDTTPAPVAAKAAPPADSPAKPKSIPVANPITDADKLGQQPAPPQPPAAASPAQPAGSSQQYQPSLIPTPEPGKQKPADQKEGGPNLSSAGQAAA